MAQTQNPCKLWQLLLEAPDDERIKKQIVEFGIVEFMRHLDACKACFDCGCKIAGTDKRGNLDQALDVLLAMVEERAVSAADYENSKIHN